MTPLPSTELLEEYLNYDPSKGVLLWKKKTAICTKIGSIAGRQKPGSHGRYSMKFFNKDYQIHRVVWKFIHKKDPIGPLDHIDGNPTNNRIDNLREATWSQNCHNQKILKRNKSGIKGVCWDKRAKSWKAYVSIDRKKHHLGYFKDISIAKRAIEKNRLLIHKEFTNHG
jgi:hypothetical protein